MREPITVSLAYQIKTEVDACGAERGARSDVVRGCGDRSFTFSDMRQGDGLSKAQGLSG